MKKGLLVDTKKKTYSSTRGWKNETLEKQIKREAKKKQERHKKQRSKKVREGSRTNNFLVSITGWWGRRGSKERRAYVLWSGRVLSKYVYVRCLLSTIGRHVYGRPYFQGWIDVLLTFLVARTKSAKGIEHRWIDMEIYRAEYFPTARTWYVPLVV